MLITWNGTLKVEDDSITSENYDKYFDSQFISPDTYNALMSKDNPESMRGVSCEFLKKPYRDAVAKYEISGFRSMFVKLPRYVSTIQLYVDGREADMNNLYHVLDTCTAQAVKSRIITSILEDSQTSGRFFYSES